MKIPEPPITEDDTQPTRTVDPDLYAQIEEMEQDIKILDGLLALHKFAIRQYVSDPTPERLIGLVRLAGPGNPNPR
jgi:hypothetical protein